MSEPASDSQDVGTSAQDGDGSGDADREPTLFEWAGGLAALTRMTRIFYERYVPEDPLLAPLFAGRSADHPERVAAWLGETFGGPKTYTETYGGYPHMVAEHLGKGISEAQRSRWARLICQAADDAGLPSDPEFRAAFVSYIEWGSRIALENSQPGARPAMGLPVPRWDWGTAGPPGRRISALSDYDEEVVPATLPDAGGSVGFEAHVKPLFRQIDRQSMRWAFDLWSYDDVAQHAAEILQRVSNGSMPCDEAWSVEKVAILRRWVDAGTPR